MPEPPLPPEPEDALPEIPALPEFLQGTPDRKAYAESAGFAHKNLEEVAGRNEHTRRQRLLENMSWAAVIMFWLGVAIVAAAVVSVAWHYLLPESFAWLSTRQLEKLQAMLLSGTVFSLISGYAARYLRKSE